MTYAGVLSDLLTSQSKEVYSWDFATPSASDKWLQLTFAGPRRLTSFVTGQSTSPNTSARGLVIGIDNVGAQTTINSNFLLAGSNPLMVNSPISYKAYRFVFPANTSSAGFNPVTLYWSTITFA